MNRRVLISALLLFGLSLSAHLHGGETGRTTLAWDELPLLPDPIGVGGPFVGVHGKALIVAGGANFPGGPPWERVVQGETLPPGKKIWHAQVYVLEPGAKQWHVSGKLSQPLAYGLAVSTAHGVYLIGGSTQDGVAVNDVYLLTWDPESQKLTIEEHPAKLPKPSDFVAGGIVDDHIYVAASHRSNGANRLDQKSFWRLKVAGEERAQEWQSLKSWPGTARHKMAAAVQSAGSKKKYLYFFSGSTPYYDEEGKADLAKFEFFTDGFRYDPVDDTWETIAGLPVVPDIREIDGKERFEDSPRPVAASPCIDIGQSHILVFSGATGRYVTRPVDQRPLFPQDVLAYHTITDTWTRAGQMPLGVVTTQATKWQGGIVIPSGEIRPGVRTRNVQLARVQKSQAQFGAINYAVVIIYLALMVGMGVYFSRREKSSEDFFIAGKRIPWWAAGLSIYATLLSAITFVSSPALAYTTDWVAFPQKLSIFLMAPVVIAFYLPFFRRLNVTSAYEYLERRFNIVVRLIGSLSFILFQLGRMAIVIYLPALALSAVTGVDVYICVIVIGVLSTIYTVLGGMEAVVWTDVLQTVVLMGGILIGFILIVFDAGGIGPLFETALADGKLRQFDWRFSFTDMVTWSAFIGVFFLNFPPYTTDQAVVQRYLTTKDEKAAAKSIWLNGMLAIPGGALFFLMGTGMYVFFKNHPELLSIGMANDEVLPLYVVNQLPNGISGLVIAGVFAASMSSLDSSLHSVATAVTTDFYKRFRADATDQQSLRLARAIVIVLGVVAIVLACALVSWDIKSLFVFFQKVLGLLGSGLAGVFVLGIFTKRCTAMGAMVGFIVSALLLFYTAFFTNIHPYVFGIIGMGGCIISGYVFSFLTPAPATGALSGLTLGTQKEAKAQ